MAKIKSTKQPNGCIEREVTINYEWSDSENKRPKAEHIEALEESAMKRIIEMMDEGYTSGELFDTVRMSDKDGIEYYGFWRVSTKVIF